jgi:tungstate transport system permease protein
LRQYRRVENFLPIVALSLEVSLSATLLASVAGISAAAVLALLRFPGRRLLVVAVNALLGLPPVVVGLALYLLLSNQGPLGALGLLFTPVAMVLAQAILATPIVAALAHRVLEARWAEYGRAFEASGASRFAALPHLLAMSLRPLTTAVLAGFGRTISEVGAVLIVGGNIALHTRIMTTTIVLETSRGNLQLALSLGLMLIGISIAVSSVVLLLGKEPG